MINSPSICRRSLLSTGIAVCAVSVTLKRAEAAAPIKKPDRAEIDDVIKPWTAPARDAATAMIQKYGVPQGVTSGLLIWRDNTPWVRTIVFREGADHAFATPHKDVLEQVIKYKVPLNFLEEIAKYNGSILVDRTRGEIAARSQEEATNFLALNLTNDIVHGKRNADKARAYHTQMVRQLISGQKPEYTTKLLFGPPQGNTADPDVTTLPEATGASKHQ